MFRRAVNGLVRSQGIRSFHSSSRRMVAIENFDVFSMEQADIYFQGYGDGGFRLQDHNVLYSLFLLPHSAFLWNVPTIDQLTTDSLSILEVIPPIGLFFVFLWLDIFMLMIFICFFLLELLLIGTGKENVPIPDEITHYLNNLGIKMIEVQSTVSKKKN